MMSLDIYRDGDAKKIIRYFGAYHISDHVTPDFLKDGKVYFGIQLKVVIRRVGVWFHRIRPGNGNGEQPCVLPI
jgi:hypothetical protein